MENMTVMLVADNKVFGSGIGNMFNLIRCYEALTDPERSQKLNSVIPILRISCDSNPCNGEGFSSFENDLDPWMKKKFTREELTPHLVICLSGTGTSSVCRDLTEKIQKIKNEFNVNLPGLIDAKRKKKKDEANQAWEREKAYLKMKFWMGFTGTSGYRKYNTSEWDVEEDLTWKENNMDK